MHAHGVMGSASLKTEQNVEGTIIFGTFIFYDMENQKEKKK